MTLDRVKSERRAEAEAAATALCATDIQFLDRGDYPLDIIVADDDGVSVVPCDRAAAIMATAEERMAGEEAPRARSTSGELCADIYDMRACSKAKGLTDD